MGILGKGLGGALKTIVMGTNYERDKRQKEALARAALMAAGLFDPIEGATRQAQISNDDREDITAAFAPQMEQGPSRKRTPAEMARELARISAATPGFNPTPYKDLAALGMPEVRYDRGFGYDQKTGEAAGNFHPDLDKGMIPDGQGGVANAAGYVKSAAEAAGAVAGAQEGAKAGWDLVDVEINGKPVKLPRAVAAPLLAQAFGRDHPGATGGEGAPAGFGVGLTPEQQAAQRASGQTEGEAGAKARIDLPTVASRGQQSVTLIDSLIKDPELKYALGWWSKVPALPNSHRPGMEAKIDQLQGATFLQAYNDLKGAGAISEAEGAKAENAIARLKRRDQSEEDFRAALTDLRSVIDGGVKRAQGRAGLGAGPAARPAAPAAPRTTMGRSRIISVQ